MNRRGPQQAPLHESQTVVNGLRRRAAGAHAVAAGIACLQGFAAAPAAAQYVIDQYMPRPASAVVQDGQWRGAAGAALSFSSGNTDSAAVLVNALAVRATADDKISLTGNLHYGRGKDSAGLATTSAQKAWMSGAYDWNLAPRWFTSLRAGAETDALIDLDLRALMVAGLGYTLVDKEDTTLSLTGGLAYTREQYDRPKTIGDRVDTRFQRTSLYLAEESRHRLAPTVSLNQRFEVYPGVSGDKAVLARFTGNLSVGMTRTLQLNVGLVHTYNSQPPDGARRSDTALFTGVNLRFGPD